MRLLKIGVLTFHRCINYGSYWQALSLVRGLQQRGHNVVLLDHHSRKVNIAEWKCALQPVLPTPVPPGDHERYRSKMKGFFKAFEDMPLSAPFPLHNPEQMEEFDLIVVGSDEVWNLAHPWYGQCPLFYGKGLKAPMLVSYAASFGNYDAAWQLPSSWAELLRGFDLMAVRDENSRTIVHQATGMDPDMVLDPCLQFPPEPEERSIPYAAQSYIAVYGHNFSPALVSHARQYAGQMNLPLVSIGYRNDWADEQWIEADPHQFAQFIRQSAGVVTNFFHGCVFALRYERPFVCATTHYRNIKIHSLLQQLGGLAHLVTEEDHPKRIQATLDTPIAPAILSNIHQLRTQSNSYLDRALGLQQYQYA